MESVFVSSPVSGSALKEHSRFLSGPTWSECRSVALFFNNAANVIGINLKFLFRVGDTLPPSTDLICLGLFNYFYKI